MINSQHRSYPEDARPSISKGMGDQFSASNRRPVFPVAVYQRGWVINSQLKPISSMKSVSISKGMGDQFSAVGAVAVGDVQNVKGDG